MTNSYQSYLNEIESINRPCLILLRSEEGVVLLAENKRFGELKKYEIDTERLMHSLNFIKYCKELLDSKSFTKSDDQINLGKHRRVVELYGTAHRTREAGFLDPYKSDLIVIQISIQELVTTDGMFRTPAMIHSAHDGVLSQVAHLYKEIDDLEESQRKQQILNEQDARLLQDVEEKLKKIQKFLESNKLLQFTRNITLTSLFKVITVLILLASLTDLGEKPISDNTKDAVRLIKELLK